jgi:hypothetical protein
MTILSQSRGYTMTVCRGLLDCYKLCIWRKTGFKCSIGINNIAPFQTLIVLLGRKYKNSPIIILVTKELFEYRQLLQHVKAQVRRFTGRNFSPDKAVCDFEQALQSAVETELQNTRICSCYFHFCQSL